jgi:hypothetical protein
MFKEIEDRLDITNELLRKIEQHLRDLTLPPDVVDWSKKLDVKKKGFSPDDFV